MGASNRCGHWVVDRGRWHRFTRRMSAVIATVSTVAMLSACGSTETQTYDIRPIFPLDSDKCDRYEGTAEGRSCFVTKEQCERAAADWREAMSGVSGAIQFRC